MDVLTKTAILSFSTTWRKTNKNKSMPVLPTTDGKSLPTNSTTLLTSKLTMARATRSSPSSPLTLSTEINTLLEAFSSHTTSDSLALTTPNTSTTQDIGLPTAWKSTASITPSPQPLQSVTTLNGVGFMRPWAKTMIKSTNSLKLTLKVSKESQEHSLGSWAQ